MRDCRVILSLVTAVVVAGVGALAQAALNGAAAATPSAAGLRDYTVQVGDSCGHIAKRLYGSSHRVDLIHEYNELGPPPHKLRPGLVLRLPIKAGTGSLEPNARLSFVRNQVEAYTPNYHRGQAGEALVQGNRVGTLATSSAEIAFVNETRMQLGEHSMIVIFGDSAQAPGRHRRTAGSDDAMLLRGTLRAHLAELSGPNSEPRPIRVTTPGAAVELPVKGSEVHLDVDGGATTRLSVLRGRSALASAGRKVQVPAGFGSRADKGKAPTTPRPLPGAPSWNPAPPQLLLGRGGQITAELRYAAGVGPPVAAWHRQMARDANFNDLIEDVQAPADSLTWTLRKLPEGELYARVSGIDGDHFEGPASLPARIRAAVVGQLPAGPGATAVVVAPHGLLCSLDGATLAEGRRAALAPARDHLVRCSMPTEPSAAAELTIATQDSGPLLVELQSAQTRWTANAGEREVRFRLTDNASTPVAVPLTELVLNAAPGVEVAPLTSGAAGEYRTEVRWSAAVAELGLAVQLRGVKLAAVPLPLDSRDSEPPPARPAAPPAMLTPAAPLAPRISWQFAAAGAVLLNQDVNGVGGLLDLGPRFRLPFGWLALTLRAGVEQHLAPRQAPFLVNLGAALMFVIGQPTWRLTPYLGPWTQVMLQSTPLPSGAYTLEQPQAGLVLGGLAGAQLRLWRGGLFAEVGYRHILYQPTSTAITAWNTALVLLGYRFLTN